MEQSIQFLLGKIFELGQLLGSAVARIEASEKNYGDLDERIVCLEKLEGRLLVLEASSSDSKSDRQVAIAIASVIVSAIAVGFAIYFGFRAR